MAFWDESGCQKYIATDPDGKPIKHKCILPTGEGSEALKLFVSPLEKNK